MDYKQQESRDPVWKVHMTLGGFHTMYPGEVSCFLDYMQPWP